MLPNPAGQVFARRIFKARNLIQEMMIQLILYRFEREFHISEIAEPTHMLIHPPSEAQLNSERVSVQATALVPHRDIR